MSLISRYLLRLHLVPFLFALSALTGIMMVNQIAKRLKDLVGKGLPWHVIAEVFGLSVPFIMAMTLPMAVLVAVLFSMSRLTADSELTALRAGGVSLGRVTRPVLLAGIGVAVFSFLFSDLVLPQANHRLRTLLTDISRTKSTFGLEEQVINEVQRSKMFLRAGAVEQNTSTLRDVTIVDLSDNNRKRVTYADSAYMAFAGEDLYLTLFDGTMHETDRIEAENFQIARFARDRVRVEGVGGTFTRTLEDTYKGDREMGICEMDSVVVAAAIERESSLRRAWSVEVNSLRGSLGLAPLVHDTVPPPVSPRPYCRLRTALASIATPGAAEAAVADSTPVAAGDAGQERSGPTVQPDRAASPPVRQPSSAAIEEALNENARQVFAGRVTPPRINSAQVLRDRAEDAEIRIATYLVEVHKKYAIAAACIVFVLVGIPAAIRFPRGGVGLVVGMSLVIFTVYYVGLIAGESLGNKMIIPPFWAMWTPNIVFAIIGTTWLYVIRRESGGRGGDGIFARWFRRRTA